MASSYKYPGHHVYDGIIYHHHVLPSTLDRIKNELVLDPSDLLVVTYPKSGTTWTLELAHSIDVGLERSRARTDVMDQIFPFIEHKGRDEGQVQPYDLIMSRHPPRRIKTHLPVTFYTRLLENHNNCPKFIVTLRNPKDTLVSFFHHHKMIPRYAFENITWDDFFNMFKEKQVHFGDVIDFNLGWWTQRHHPNVLVLHYEQMLADSQQAVRQIAQFMGRSLSEQEVNEIREHSCFDQMQRRGMKAYHQGAHYFDESRSTFFRKGERGDWRHLFTEEQSNYVDDLVKTLCEPEGLHYQY